MNRTFLRYAFLAATLLIGVTAIGAAVSPNIVISQVYGGGGNSGATYTHDYIELFNRGATTVSLTGWSVQYASATGTGLFSSSVTALSGSLAPGQYYLVQEGAGAGGTSPLPTPDATGSIAMAAGAGKVIVVNSTTGLACNGGSTPCSASQLAMIVDLVGYGTANFFEGAGPAPTLSNTTSAFRASGGCTDTDNNSADFTAGTAFPNARNTASALNVCGGPINPSGVGAADPSSVEPGDTTLLTVTVTPGANPTSTGLAVTGDLSMIGGSATQAFRDDGLSGDVTAGDLVFSYSATVGFATTTGNKSLPATITDAQGRTAGTTIPLSVFVELAIHEIQGSGTSSPVNGAVVRTTGVVTGVRFNNGFFIQEPDSSVDGDPNTSEGIFVFTSSAPPATASVGNLVRVTGTVFEFVPSQDPFSPPVTELVGPLTVNLVSTGNTLPAPVALTPADTSPGGSIEQLEKFEGMRVAVSSLTVVGPTLGSINEPNATATSNGVFYGVITDTIPRPFREPGIQVPNPLPPGSPCCIPRFDANPERLRVDSDGLVGAVRLEAASGATIANLVGPLDFGFRTYTVLPDPDLTQADVVGNVSATPVRVRTSDEFTVGSYNLQRFFDDVNDPAIGEPVLTATAFSNRLSKASLAIRNVLRSPDILGVVEVENLTTLQSLAAKLNADDSSLNYVAYLAEGNDIGGIDVGFLVNDNRVDVVDVTQEGKDTTFIDPNTGEPALLNDRPPLLLRANVNPGAGAQFPVTVIVNHLRSLGGVEDPLDGNRVRTKRLAQAEFLANLVQVRQTANPGERIVVVGDFNAFQFNDGLVDSIGTIKGMPAPADMVVLASRDLVTPDFTNLVNSLPVGQRYSFVFDGNAQVLDHVLVGSNLLGHVRGIGYGRLGADFPESFRNDPSRPERVSDHDGIVAVLTFDLDGDGFPDDSDACPASNLAATVVIDSCETGVENDLLSDGCTISDRIDACGDAAVTHEDFTGCVTHLTRDLKDQGSITNREKGHIQKCAGMADIP